MEYVSFGSTHKRPARLQTKRTTRQDYRSDSPAFDRENRAPMATPQVRIWNHVAGAPGQWTAWARCSLGFLVGISIQAVAGSHKPSEIILRTVNWSFTTRIQYESCWIARASWHCTNQNANRLPSPNGDLVGHRKGPSDPGKATGSRISADGCRLPSSDCRRRTGAPTAVAPAPTDRIPDQRWVSVSWSPIARRWRLS